jgi:threonine dehydratase
VTTPGSLTAEDVRTAHERIRRHLPPTPLRRSHGSGPGAHLKLECWQPTGSFKVRGALNFLLSFDPDARGVPIVAASAGNHALGVAFAAQAVGWRGTVTLYVPRSAPRAKVEKLRRFGVSVVEEGATYEEAQAAASSHARAAGALPVHPFDDPRTAAGQGTVAVELLHDLPEVATIVVPCGGGGLVAATAVYAKAVRPAVRIVAVQPEASPSLRESLRSGRPLYEYAAAPTLADGLAGGIGDIVFDHRRLIDDVVVVSEAEIEETMVALLLEEQLVTEGSGAAGVAAVRAGKVRPLEGPTAIVVTGANVDAAVLRRLLGERS